MSVSENPEGLPDIEEILERWVVLAEAAQDRLGWPDSLARAWSACSPETADLAAYSSPERILALAAAHREQQRELDEFKRIRNLLVKALARATGADDASVREDPLTIAVRHARRIAELEAENARLREPMARYTKEGNLQPGWTPVDAGRLDELEQAESRLQAALGHVAALVRWGFTVNPNEHEVRAAQAFLAAQEEVRSLESPDERE